MRKDLAQVDLVELVQVEDIKIIIKHKNMHLVFYFLTFFSLMGCNQSKEKEIYLIQSGFKGKVNVIFNNAKGEPTKYENGVRIYEIPKDGILLTQFKVQEGLIKRDYYYVDGSGKRNPLKIMTDSENTNDSEIGIFRDGTIGVYGDSNDKNSLTYQEFYVTDKNKLEGYFTDESINEFNKRVQVKTGYKF
ncbi:MAG: hypothetical protein J7574_09725 [Flavobacterium sp.]|uniref:DUF6843 domain-containing protein n=1 Tax=Flavobacterium sp. TaxID=239 RepID=UPI001B0397D4|nr:hypothetical protein [Flavobacterium sp.]MBO9584424.1 hypothetical protein [Flavobacterium sp.]